MKIRLNKKAKKLTFVLPQKKFYNKANKFYQMSKQDLKVVQNYIDTYITGSIKAIHIFFKYGYSKQEIDRTFNETGIILPDYGLTSTVLGIEEIQDNPAKLLTEFIGNELIDYADQILFEKQYDFAFNISQVFLKPLSEKKDPLENLKL